MKRFLHIAFLGILFFSFVEGVFADDYEPSDEPENSTNNFLLDADDTGGDVEIQFGLSLAETLKWNSSQSYFELSDDLVIDGNTNLNGTIFRLDFDNVGVGADIDILAEQGSDNDGTLRYSASNNQWEVSNDGGAFEAINISNVLNAYDSDGGVPLTITQTVVSIETDRISDSAYTNSTGTVTINLDGLYRVSGWVTVLTSGTAGAARNNLVVVFQDDTGGAFADVPGSRCQAYQREQNAGDPASSCFVSYIKSYNDTDILRMTHFMDTANNTVNTVANASGMTIELIRPE